MNKNIRNVVTGAALAVSVTVPLTMTAYAATAAKSTTSTASSSSSTTSTSSTAVTADPVIQSYTSKTTLQPGMIVNIADSKGTSVTPSTTATMKTMFGVVINPADVSVTVSDLSTTQQNFVAPIGVYNVLVSTEGGAIKAGDYITVSSISGVGMKAGTGQSTVLGRADGDFGPKTGGTSTVTLSSSNGQHVTVTIGQVLVDIDIGRNPSLITQTPNVPSFLEKVALQTVHQPVKANQVYLSIIVLLLTLVIVSTVLYSGVRSSFVAVGRNPLSRGGIFKALFSVIIASLAIFLLGLFAVYLIVKL